MTTANPVKISVIIPVYNVEKYLSACLDSFLNQPLKDIEIICIDDCSTDNSAQILREYASRDERIKNIFLTQNGGVSHARNIAIERANGKYTYFADADDLTIPEAMEKLYDTAEKNDTDQVVFLTDVLEECENASMCNYYSRTYSEKTVNRVLSGLELFSQLLQSVIFTAPWSKITRTSIIKDNNIQFPHGYIHSDNFFTAKSMLFCKKAIALNERLYIRRIREGSITTATDAGATIRHVCGFAAVIGTFQTEINSGLYDKTQNELVQKFCTFLIPSLMRYTQKLHPSQRPELLSQLINCPWGEHWQFVMPILFRLIDTEKKKNCELVKADKTIAYQKNKIKKLKKSRSYRLGRALTWLPRKIRGGVRCLKQHGVAYTCKRIFQKTGILFK
ncbi:MAG: glycosyltransferase [Lentisphaerae bacterium]|nr:glycosyltransferase [Lentisphaerota bacterium]